MRAKILKEMIDIDRLTIGDALLLKHVLDLTDYEAISIFLGGATYEDIQV